MRDFDGNDKIYQKNFHIMLNDNTQFMALAEIFIKN